MDAGDTIGARVEALHGLHRDHFRHVYALLSTIQLTFVKIPLDIVRQSVLFLRSQPTMLSQLWCETKIYHLTLENMIRDLQLTTRQDLPLCLDIKISL